MISQETVETAFRLILGREPESPEVVEAHRHVADVETLRRILIGSREFEWFYEVFHDRDAENRQQRIARRRAATAAGDPSASGPAYRAQDVLQPVNPVETEAAPDLAGRLWTRVAESWSELGRTAPHWSVLTHDEYRPEALEANRAAFERSGEVEGDLVDAALDRFPDLDPAALHCLEIGCGVGRATRALARRFGRVTGVDVSAGHLEIAARELAAAGHDNVDLRHAQAVDDYTGLPEVDFFYSRIVLQHNPPPVQRAVLGAVFDRLRPGGVALFQVVTFAHRYAYRVADDLEGRQPAMEMHPLPQRAVFALMAARGMRPLEVQEDFAAGIDGPYRSHLFLATKPRNG